MSITKNKFLDLDISLEFKAGEIRKGTSAAGIKWEQEMPHDYGYIVGTNSPDGEQLDIVMATNPDENCDIYVIHQLTPDGSTYDEDKVMLGFKNPKDAKDAFKEFAWKGMKMYGAMSEYDIRGFKVLAYMLSGSSAILATDEALDEMKKKKITIPKSVKDPVDVAKKISEYRIMNSDMESIKAFNTIQDAELFLESLPNGVAKLYSLDCGNRRRTRMLTEGLRKGDLENIITPRVSIDEYLPSGAETNVVVALFTRNAYDAAESLRKFCDNTPGVVETGASDSDTVKRTSIVYVEFDKDVQPEIINNLITQVFKISCVKIHDVMLKFPRVKTGTQYTPEKIESYLQLRSTELFGGQK